MTKDSAKVLHKTKDFWDGNPCDGQETLNRRSEFRYKKEPWLQPLLDEVTKYSNILEVGCGQGTDALYCCQHLQHGSSYTAVDLSPKSIEQAKVAACEIRHALKVEPEFMTSNAENLDFDDESFDCVISIGVLHHTHSLDKALSDVHRVLKKDGVAIIALYRLFSLKLLAAYAVRFSVGITGLKKPLMSLLKRVGTNHFLGTMLLECIGVPVLNSYTGRGLEKKFNEFRKISVQPVGIGFTLFGLNKFIDTKLRWFGSMLVVKAHK